MAKTGISETHLKFIQLAAKGMSLAKAYATSCDKNATGPNCRSQGSRLAKKYATEIQNAKTLILNAKDKAIEDEVVREEVNNILSQIQVDRRLCDIIKGEFEVKERIQNIFTKTVDTVLRKPNASETVRAIDVYYKRMGSYSPEKKEEVIKVVNLTQEQVQQISDTLEERV